MIDAIIEYMSWIFSGIGTTIAGAIFTAFFLSKKKRKQQNKLTITSADSNQKDASSYKEKLGERHKFLRENILQINMRNMAAFYQFSSVTELEEYESGKKEFPIEAIDKLISIFRIDKRYLEREVEYVFDYFQLDQENVDKLVKDGWEVYLLCSTEEKMHVWPVFHKYDGEISFCAVSDMVGSFASSGGGRTNIEFIIHSIIKNNYPAYRVRIYSVSEQIWRDLKASRFYSNDMNFGAGCANYECMDVFYEWYQSICNNYYSKKVFCNY